MRVEEIMTKDVCSCSPGMNAATAAEIMWTRNCGSLPIVEDSGRVVGIVTDRDLFLALGTSNRKPSELSVGEIMSKDLALCNPGNDVRIALGTMAQRQLRRLPVVDEVGAVKGILSLGDIASAGQLHSFPGGLVREREAAPACGANKMAREATRISLFVCIETI